jgi:hypothetical protein
MAVATDDLIAARWVEVEKIAKALLEEKTLSGARVRELSLPRAIAARLAPQAAAQD